MIYPRKYPTVVGGMTMQHHLYFDEMQDLPNLPKLDKVAKGSDAYCLETKMWFILSSNNVWLEQPSNGGGTVASFSIAEFNNDREWNEKGIPVTGVNFSWEYAAGIPASQSIAPLIGEVPVSQRSSFLGGQNIVTDTMFTLTAVDSDGVTKAAITEIKFFYPIFVGLVDSATPVESEILLMNKRIAPASSFIQNFVIDDKRSAIAIHNSLPPLSDIREMLFGSSVMGSFNVNNISIDAGNGAQVYRVYIFNSIQNTLGLNSQLQFVWS